MRGRRAVTIGTCDRLPQTGSLEPRLPQPLQLGLDFRALIEAQPPANAARCPRRTVGHLRVAVQAWARRVPPRPRAILPAGDDPALATPVPAGGERLGEDLVLVGPAGEPG